MPKMSKFRKALRLAEKAHKHFFRNGSYLHKSFDPIDGYQAERRKDRAIKSLHKDNRGQRVITN